MDIFKKILQRIEAIWTDDIKEKLRDEAIWGKFRIRWDNILKSLKVTGDDWNKFSSCNSQVYYRNLDRRENDYRKRRKRARED
jgi:hypothetical protein